MNLKYNYSLKHITLLAICFVFNTTTACAGDSVPPRASDDKKVLVPVDKKAKFVIAVDEVGNVVTMTGVNKNGEPEPAKECALCTRELAHKFDGHCDKLVKDDKLRSAALSQTLGKEKANLSMCTATTRATISDIKQFSLMFMHKNPDCIVRIEEGGRTVYTYPPECAH